jgi:hypothetical protein
VVFISKIHSCIKEHALALRRFPTEEVRRGKYYGEFM